MIPKGWPLTIFGENSFLPASHAIRETAGEQPESCCPCAIADISAPLEAKLIDSRSGRVEVKFHPQLSKLGCVSCL